MQIPSKTGPMAPRPHGTGAVEYGQSAGGSGEAAGACAVLTRVTLAEGMAARFADWQSSLVRDISAADGFASIELIATYRGSPDWQIIQRFASAGALDQWRRSDMRADLFAALEELCPPGAARPTDEASADFHAASFVTEVVATRVEPGREEEFRAWAEAMQARQARFPGYMGTLVQAPVAAGQASWTTLVRFATAGEMEAWLASAERKTQLAGADPATSSWQSRRLNTGFASWFTDAGEPTPPPAWKQTALVLLVLFPVVMLEIRFLSPHLAGLNLAVATFIGNAISVALVSWPLMAIAIRCLGWWLRPAPARRWPIEVLGAATVLGLYAAEIFTFILLF
jgi:uncharacterized protein